MSEQEIAVPEDLFDYEELPSVKELVSTHNMKRDDAREFLVALRSASEADEEATISADEHLSKLINEPLKAEIRRITESNRKLAQELESAGPMSELTPQEIEAMIAENTKQLLNIKKTLAETNKNSAGGGTNLTIDIGSIFQDALKGARDATIDV